LEGQTVTLDICVSATASKVSLILVQRGRYKIGGYGWSTGGLKFGLHPGGWMQVDMFNEKFEFLFTCLRIRRIMLLFRHYLQTND
jgi:hypothetical protein